MVILAEELALLAFDDESGRNKVQHLDLGLAGAVLMDLTLAERIDMQGARVQVISAQPTGHPVLDNALERISAFGPKKPKRIVDKINRGLRSPIMASLTEQRIVSHEESRVMGFIPVNRYRPLNPAITANTRTQLETAVAQGVATDARTACLAGLVRALRMEKRALPGRGRSETRRALKNLSQGSWATDATQKAVEAAQAAVMAAITASVAAASAGGAAGSS